MNSVMDLPAAAAATLIARCRSSGTVTCRVFCFEASFASAAGVFSFDSLITLSLHHNVTKCASDFLNFLNFGSSFSCNMKTYRLPLDLETRLDAVLSKAGDRRPIAEVFAKLLSESIDQACSEESPITTLPTILDLRRRTGADISITYGPKENPVGDMAALIRKIVGEEFDRREKIGQAQKRKTAS